MYYTSEQQNFKGHLCYQTTQIHHAGRDIKNTLFCTDTPSYRIIMEFLLGEMLVHLFSEKPLLSRNMPFVVLTELLIIVTQIFYSKRLKC